MPADKPDRGEERLFAEAQISVGRFLRATREALSLTQAQVAERTRGYPWRLSRAAVSAIERGQNFPGLEAMVALSNVLHIDPKELIERARLTAVVPVDVAGLSDRDLEDRAGQYFWAGDYKRALSIYDALALRLASGAPTADREELVARQAALEVRRATALKRAGALISAISSAERAISLSANRPEIQAEAYVVLAELQAQRGHLPLARDAAERSIELAAETGNRRTLAWGFVVKGRVLHARGDFERAKGAFLEALSHAEASEDRRHLTHISGNVGMCWLEQNDTEQARSWIHRAVDLARLQKQPTLEASWLCELGKIALREGRSEEADRLARAALKVARPREHHLTVFRAEWLRHLVHERTRPGTPDRARLKLLNELYHELERHEGIEEIQEYRARLLGGAAPEAAPPDS
jgi:transcriptional regulator with XRE-family HTH domain